MSLTLVFPDCTFGLEITLSTASYYEINFKQKISSQIKSSATKDIMFAHLKTIIQCKKISNRYKGRNQCSR